MLGMAVRYATLGLRLAVHKTVEESGGLIALLLVCVKTGEMQIQGN